MSGSARSRIPLRPLLSSIAGWRTTTPCIRIPGWAIAHLGSTSFPNPLRVRFDGVNSNQVPRRIVLDIDDTEDRVHGGHKLARFNAYYARRCVHRLHTYEAT